MSEPLPTPPLEVASSAAPQRGRTLWWVAALLGLGVVLIIGLGYTALTQKKTQPAAQAPHTMAQSKTLPEPIALGGQAQITALFAPQDDIQSAIITLLNQARSTIRVQAYLLTDDAIARALIRAHQRGVTVEVLLDAQRITEAKGSDALALHEAGIIVRMETDYTNAHNKIMLIDEAEASGVLLTGSYNFTLTAQRENAENVLLIRGAPELMQRYVRNWQAHWQRSQAFANAVSG